MSTVSAQEYLARANALSASAAKSQLHSILQAAGLIADAILSGGRWWVFGTGHSHLLAEEVWGRAGGLKDVRAVLIPSLMLHEGLEQSSRLERTSGLAQQLLDEHGVARGDTVLVASNSGRNAVPVEFAAGARARGAHVIALTSLSHSTAVSSRVPGGAKLMDVADVVIDNGGVPGDAILERERGAVGATSTVIGALLLQAVAVEVVRLLDEAGKPADTYVSFNA